MMAIIIPPLKKTSRMSRTKLLGICVAVLVLVNAGTLFYLFRTQKSSRQMPPEKGEGPAAYIIEQLKLDAQQQAEFKKLRDEHQATMRPAREEDKRLHQVFFSLVKTGKAAGAETDSLIGLMAAQRKLMEQATFTHFQKLRNLCTDAQKPKLDELVDELATRMSGNPGRPPGPPGSGNEGGPPPGEHNGPPPGERQGPPPAHPPGERP